MNQLSHTLTVHAPIARVWETLADVGSIENWHPGVATSPVISDHRTGLGAARKMELADGSSVVETISAQEEGRSVTVLMSEHKMPLSHGAATFSAEPAGSDQTRVTMTMDYAMKFGPLGWLLNLLLLRRVMGNMLPGILAGLNHHLVTGEKIEAGWTPAEA